MKEQGLLYARQVIWRCLCILPVPFGLITIGTAPAMLAGVLLTGVLVLIVPLVMHYKAQKKGVLRKGESYLAVLYSWLLTVFVATGLAFSAEPVFEAVSTIMNIVFTTLCIIALVAVQHGVYVGISYWQGRKRSHWLSPFIDPVLYAVPFPTVFLGTSFCLFLSAMRGEEVGMGLFSGFVILVGVSALLFALFVMATLVFYFYPHKKEYPTWWPKRALAFLRIVVMGIIWVVAHKLIVGLSFSFLLGWLTALSAPLSYILIFLLEAAVLSIAIAFGQLVPVERKHTP